MVHPDLRASDADRYAAADQLAGHTAVGRLSLDEFDRRVRAVWAAQTHGELHRLFADLPRPVPTPQASGLELQASRLQLVAIVVAVLVAVLGLAVPVMAWGTVPGCM
jgi:hypothetical protein